MCPRSELITSPFRDRLKPHWTFNTLGDFLGVCEKKLDVSPMRLDLARKGDASLVPQAETFLADLEVEIMQNTPQVELDVCGFAPNVPAFLAGAPDNMFSRRVQRNPSRFNPLNIFYCVSSSSGLDRAQVIRRGIAVLGLYLSLAKTRPVTLWTFNDGSTRNMGVDYFNVKIKASTVLSELCFVLTSQVYALSMCYALEEADVGHLGFTPHSMLRESLGASESDLVFGPALLTDPLVMDPVGFIKRTIARLNCEDDSTMAHEEWIK